MILSSKINTFKTKTNNVHKYQDFLESKLKCLKALAGVSFRSLRAWDYAESIGIMLKQERSLLLVMSWGWSAISRYNRIMSRCRATRISTMKL